MARRKNYLPIGKEPLYDKKYDKLRIQSPILNGGNVSTLINLQDLRGLEAYKEKIQESISGTERELKKLESDWKDYVQSRVNMGYYPPEEETPDFKIARLQMEASLDVSREEIHEIDRRISILEKEQTKERSGQVLRNGLIGSARLRGGVIVEIDGQRVSLIKKIPVIDEPASKYDGLAVADYRVLSGEWQKAKSLILNENQKIFEKAIRQGYTDAEAQRMMKATRPPFPDWKPGMKNLKK